MSDSQFCTLGFIWALTKILADFLAFDSWLPGANVFIAGGVISLRAMIVKEAYLRHKCIKIHKSYFYTEFVLYRLVMCTAVAGCVLLRC